MRGSAEISMDPGNRSKVLLLGNGLLRLSGGINWSDLLQGIPGGQKISPDALEAIPYNMRAEAVCGTDIESIRRSTAFTMKDCLSVSSKLQDLLQEDFDCILTTNYTYEIETLLSGKPFSKIRRKSIRTFGKQLRHTNMSQCYEVVTPSGKSVQVWHIHGDAVRSSSMVLSYYSYAKVISELVEYSKIKRNIYYELQQSQRPLQVESWLDWFITGDVYSVGFGWDFSEIDLWWAAERKCREHAKTGMLYCFFFDKDGNVRSKEKLLKSMNADVRVIKLGSYPEGFQTINNEIHALLHS